jgi:cell division transport system permease protein
MQILIANVGQLAPAFDDAADFTVFLRMEIDESEGRSLAASIAGRADVADTVFISRDEGLRDFEAWAGFGGALDELPENPLPHVIRVRPAADAIDEIEVLATALAALEQTDSVQLDQLWIERLQSILRLSRRSINILTVLLATAVVLIVGNTIRLEINNRRVEIEVLKLVGATDGFIRRPFLYTGLWLGVLGAVSAALMVAIGLWMLSGPVRDLAELYPGDFALTGLGLQSAWQLLAAGAGLGWAGAWVATSRHLRQIEPA